MLQHHAWNSISESLQSIVATKPYRHRRNTAALTQSISREYSNGFCGVLLKVRGKKCSGGEDGRPKVSGLRIGQDELKDWV